MLILHLKPRCNAPRWTLTGKKRSQATFSCQLISQCKYNWDVCGWIKNGGGGHSAGLARCCPAQSGAFMSGPMEREMCCFRESPAHGGRISVFRPSSASSPIDYHRWHSPRPDLLWRRPLQQGRFISVVSQSPVYLHSYFLLLMYLSICIIFFSFILKFLIELCVWHNMSVCLSVSNVWWAKEECPPWLTLKIYSILFYSMLFYSILF